MKSELNQKVLLKKVGRAETLFVNMINISNTNNNIGNISFYKAILNFWKKIVTKENLINISYY